MGQNGAKTSRFRASGQAVPHVLCRHHTLEWVGKLGELSFGHFCCRLRRASLVHWRDRSGGIGRQGWPWALGATVLIRHKLKKKGKEERKRRKKDSRNRPPFTNWQGGLGTLTAAEAAVPFRGRLGEGDPKKTKIQRRARTHSKTPPRHGVGQSLQENAGHFVAPLPLNKICIRGATQRHRFGRMTGTQAHKHTGTTAGYPVKEGKDCIRGLIIGCTTYDVQRVHHVQLLRSLKYRLQKRV